MSRIKGFASLNIAAKTGENNLHNNRCTRMLRIWFDGKYELCITDFILHPCWYGGHCMNQLLTSASFFPCVPTTPKVFTGRCLDLMPHQPRVLIIRAGNDDSACGLYHHYSSGFVQRNRRRLFHNQREALRLREALFISPAFSQKVNGKDKLEANSC